MLRGFFFLFVIVLRSLKDMKLLFLLMQRGAESLCNWYFILFVLLHHLGLGYRLGRFVTDHLFVLSSLCVFQEEICYLFSVSVLLCNKARIGCDF